MNQMKVFAVAAVALVAPTVAMALRNEPVRTTSRPATSVIDVFGERDTTYERERDDEWRRATNESEKFERKRAKELDKAEKKQLKELRKAEHEREKELRKADRERRKDAHEAWREGEKERRDRAKEARRQGRGRGRR